MKTYQAFDANSLSVNFNWWHGAIQPLDSVKTGCFSWAKCWRKVGSKNRFFPWLLYSCHVKWHKKKCVAFTVASVIFTGCQCPSFFHTRLPCRSDKQKDTASKEKMSIAPFVAASWNPSHHECIRWVRKKATRLNFNRKMLRMSEKTPKKKQHFRKTSSWVALSSLKWTQETDIPPPEANSDPAIKGGDLCWRRSNHQPINNQKSQIPSSFKFKFVKHWKSQSFG